MTQEFRSQARSSAPAPNVSEILAVLGDVERGSASSFMERSIVRGLLIGPPVCLVASVVLGNLLVLIGPHRDEAFSTSINWSTGAYGFFLGIFLGPIVDAIRKERKAMEEALDHAITQFQLSPIVVGRLLEANERDLLKTAGAFARLKKRKGW